MLYLCLLKKHPLMKKNLLLTYLCLACVLSATAQKNTKHQKFGLTWQLPATWQLTAEKNTDTRFYAFPASGGQAKMDLRVLSANTSEEATQATVDFMKENNISPSFLSELTPKKIKQGKLQMQVFAKDGLDMKLDNGTSLYLNRKLVLINTDSGKKYILFIAEYYADAKPTQKDAIENIIKTLKAK